MSGDDTDRHAKAISCAVCTVLYTRNNWDMILFRDSKIIKKPREMVVQGRYPRTTSQEGQALDLSFHQVHGFCGEFYACLLGGCYQVHYGMGALPRHGAGKLEHCLNGVE